MMVRGRPSRRCEGLAGRHSASHRGHPWRSCDRERPRDRERSHARVSPPGAAALLQTKLSGEGKWEPAFWSK